MKQYKVQLEKFKKYRFSGENRLFRRFLEKKNGLSHVMGIANTHLCAKNQKKLMMESRENAKKTVFPAYFRFFGNRAPSHFGDCHFASLYQKSEKTNEPIPRKAGNRRTDEQTNMG